ncbi:hypothetical protein CL616_05145 [archaeon]|nr:hypothetical protein [archaeon]|tara:strand:+ start:694 stop:1068 length:375 start_codon:yes stop_codon:yes gene_type:complete
MESQIIKKLDQIIGGDYEGNFKNLAAILREVAVKIFSLNPPADQLLIQKNHFTEELDGLTNTIIQEKSLNPLLRSWVERVHGAIIGLKDAINSDPEKITSEEKDILPFLITGLQNIKVWLENNY